MLTLGVCVGGASQTVCCAPVEERSAPVPHPRLERGADDGRHHELLRRLRDPEHGGAALGEQPLVGVGDPVVHPELLQVAQVHLPLRHGAKRKRTGHTARYIRRLYFRALVADADNEGWKTSQLSLHWPRRRACPIECAASTSTGTPRSAQARTISSSGNFTAGTLDMWSMIARLRVRERVGRGEWVSGGGKWPHCRQVMLWVPWQVGGVSGYVCMRLASRDPVPCRSPAKGSPTGSGQGQLRHEALLLLCHRLREAEEAADGNRKLMATRTVLIASTSGRTSLSCCRWKRQGWDD